MKHLEKLARKHLGDLLLDEGLITQEQLAAAEQEHSRTGEPLGAILVESRILTEDDLARTVATEYQLPFVELATIQPNSEAREIFDAEDIQRFRFAPVDQLGAIVTLAVAELPPMEFLHQLKSATGLTPFLFVAMLGDIDRTNGVSEGSEAAGRVQATLGAIADARANMEGLSSEKGDPGEWRLDESVLNSEGWSSIFDKGNESVLKGIDPQE